MDHSINPLLALILWTFLAVGLFYACEQLTDLNEPSPPSPAVTFDEDNPWRDVDPCDDVLLPGRGC